MSSDYFFSACQFYTVFAAISLYFFCIKVPLPLLLCLIHFLHSMVLTGPLNSCSFYERDRILIKWGGE